MKSNQLLLLLFLCALSCLAVEPIPMVAGFDLVHDGKASADIVVPSNPTAIVEYAAKELQYHVLRATGCQLVIVKEHQHRNHPSASIYIGPCESTQKAGIETQELSTNVFRKKITAQAMFLVGKDGDCKPPLEDNSSMGTLFAVYDWLDTQMGVRWLWPGELGTMVSQKITISTGSMSDVQRASPFQHTRLRIGTYIAAALGQKQIDLTKEEFERFIYDTNVWLRRHRFSCAINFSYPHAYIAHWKRFGQEHPEYFALRPDGQRAPVNIGAAHLVQMCVSNPAFHKQIIADWLQERRPSKPWINGAENDRSEQDPPCGCEACRAWDSKNANEGQNSDRYAKFWLALQEEGKKYDPDATVFGHAYSNCIQPPLETKLNDRIIVAVVPTSQFPLSQRGRADFRDLWNGWAKTGAQLYLRPNYFFEGYCLPYIFAKDFAEEFQYAQQHNMVATDFDSLTGMWGAQGPNLYMLGRIHERPDMTPDDILSEYYSGFGSAAESVRNYFEYWEKVTRLRDAAFIRTHDVGGWNSMGWVGDEIFTPQTIAYGAQVLAAALTAAKSDPETLRRVEFLVKGLTHTGLTIETMQAYRAWKNNPSDMRLERVFTAKLLELDNYRKTIRNDYVVDIVFLRTLEVWSGWRSGRKS